MYQRKERGSHGNRYCTWNVRSRWMRWHHRIRERMKVGDLVKYRRCALDAGVGIVVKNAEKGKWKTAWWSILWANGDTEVVSERNLKVLNASR